LARAIEENDPALVKRLIQQGVDLNVPLADGYLPLAAAVRARSVPLVRLLLEAGADVNGVSGTNGDTALTCAAAKGFDHVVKALVEAGADVNRENLMPLSPICMAALGDRTSHTNIVRILVEAGVNLNSGKGSTLLMGACCGRTETVRVLLDAGADVNAVRPRGTALLVAIEENKPETIALLLERGARLAIRTPAKSNHPNVTPLELARKLKRRKIVAVLEAASAGNGSIQA